MIDGRVANADIPELGIGQSREQAITRGHDVVVHLEGSGIDVDGDDLAVIALFHQWANLLLVDFVPAAGEFFGGILVLSWCHDSVSSSRLSPWDKRSVPDTCRTGQRALAIKAMSW